MNDFASIPAGYGGRYDVSASALGRRGQRRAPLLPADPSVRMLTPEEQRQWEIDEARRRAREGRARNRFGPIDVAPIMSTIEQGAPSMLDLGVAAWDAIAPGVGDAIEATPRLLAAAPGAISDLARAAPGAITHAAESAPDMFRAIPEAAAGAATGLIRAGADLGEDFRNREGMFQGGILEDLWRGPAQSFERNADDLVGARASGDQAAQNRAALGAAGDQVFYLLNAAIPVEAATAGAAAVRGGARLATEAFAPIGGSRVESVVDYLRSLGRSPSADDFMDAQARFGRLDEAEVRQMADALGIDQWAPSTRPGATRAAEMPQMRPSWSQDPPMQRGGNPYGPRWSGASDAFAPIAGAGLGAGALAVAGDAEAQADGSPELLAARAQRDSAQENLAMIDRALAGGDPEAVRALQRFLNERDDGVIGDATRAAARARREELRADIEGYDQRIESLEHDEASRETRAGPIHEAFRTIGPAVAPLVGLAIGHGTRMGAVRSEGRRLARRNAEADALLSDAPLVRPDGRASGAARAEANAEASARAARLNEFWIMGGAGERVPFRAAQTERGFAPRPGAAEGSELFPPATGVRAFVRPMDVGVVGGAAADVAASTFMLEDARNNLAEAEAAAAADPSEANLAHLEAMRDAVHSWEALQRLGYGVAAGRAAGMGHRYPNARPNVHAAETERSALNRFVAPSRSRRRRRPNNP